MILELYMCQSSFMTRYCLKGNGGEDVSGHFSALRAMRRTGAWAVAAATENSKAGG